ncbi:MAG TPA: hypothetical protein VMS96_15590 [Terriglobales bacterium]|nr:hypothetical protein [Terriglobales bacterium]
MSQATFQQAGIPVEKGAEFQELKAGIERAFSPAVAGQFFKKLESKGIRIREFEKVLDKKLLEPFDPQLRRRGARKVYDALSVADQSQIRELYLRTLEQVDDELRQKFFKIYVMY